VSHFTGAAGCGVASRCEVLPAVLLSCVLVFGVGMRVPQVREDDSTSRRPAARSCRSVAARTKKGAQASSSIRLSVLKFGWRGWVQSESTQKSRRPVLFCAAHHIAARRPAPPLSLKAPLPGKIGRDTVAMAPSPAPALTTLSLHLALFVFLCHRVPRLAGQALVPTCGPERLDLCEDKCTLDGQREHSCEFECDPVNGLCFDRCAAYFVDTAIALDKFDLFCTTRKARSARDALTPEPQTLDSESL